MLAKEISRLISALGDDAYQSAVQHMVRLVLPPAEAKRIFREILAHHKHLTKLLTRGVSLLTAAADYFALYNQLLKHPVLIGAHILQINEESAYRDELTGLFNRRYLNQEIPREMERFRRFGHSFSVLMLDLDRFKEFNDENGHQAGDLALKCVANSLNNAARLYDRAIRFGGDEFVMILPQAPQKEAMLVAERVHQSIGTQTIEFQGNRYACPTVSIGVASYPLDAMDMHTLIHRADQALYRAKMKRNKVAGYKDAKRRFPRFSLHNPVPLHVVTNLGGSRIATAKDISFGGMLCETDMQFEPDATIDLILADAALGIRLPLRAKVKRMSQVGESEFQVGLSFKVTSLRMRRDLFALIDHHTSTGASPPHTEDKCLH